VFRRSQRRDCADCRAVHVVIRARAGRIPSRGIRISIPTAPGGGNDLVGRMLAQGFAERLGVPAVPENRTGAGTVIGNDIVAKSKPDGYTVLMAAGALAVNPAMYKKMPYHAARDFAPITQAASVATLVAIHPSVAAKSTRDIIDRLNRESVAILRAPQNRERLAADGADVVGSTPDAFAAFYQTELAKWAKVVKDAGTKAE
jgi:tripartite-type tricarboxylate transporter receptor subunit TctC